jgi:hypothetical protein
MLLEELNGNQLQDVCNTLNRVFLNKIFLDRLLLQGVKISEHFTY